jgi:hypothetical protein
MFNSLRNLRQAMFMLLLLGAAGAAHSQQAAADAPAAQLKAHLAASQAALRKYTWIETTSVLVNGSEKSNKQQSVYYGADGTLQKVEVASSPAPRQRPGLRGAVAAAKKEELTDYMQAAVALVKTYLPLDPNAIQAAMASGRVSVDVLDPGRRVRVNIRSFKLQGDTVAVEFDIAANRPLGIKISTYLQDPSQGVQLTAGMGQLADGTTYAANITLDAAAKNLRVNVQNGGHRKLP